MINITNILTVVFFVGLYFFLSSYIVSPNKDIERDQGVGVNEVLCAAFFQESAFSPTSEIA